MTIIVTGGAGFIGVNFIFHMMKEHPDYRIVRLDKLTYAGNISTLHPVMENDNFRFIKLDICDKADVYKLFEEEHPDIVVNFAAKSVADHCKAIDIILQCGQIGDVYNIGGHNEMKNIDIVKLICRELGKPETLIQFVEDRKGHDLRYAIDNSKISAYLGCRPEMTFEDGIKETIRWYLENRDWWERIISVEYQNYYSKSFPS